MQSKAKTVDEYLKELPDDRRETISAVRDLIRKNLQKDIEEGMQYGMIGYFIPHRVFPAGYHCDPKQPLPFICLASQKNYLSLYLMSVYMGQTELDFRNEWAKTGKKLDMGKSCIRFRKFEDLATDVIARLIRQTSAQQYIGCYQSALTSNDADKQARAAKKKATAKKPAVKKTVPKKKAKKKTAAKKSARKK